MGSRGPSPTPPDSIKFGPGVPPPPGWLSEDAVDEYVRVAAQLEIAGNAYLQQVDMSDLCTYAQAYADVCRLSGLVRGQGESLTSDKGNLYPNPNNNALSMAYTRMKNAAARLGFSPADRARISGRGKGLAGPKDDPLGAFV